MLVVRGAIKDYDWGIVDGLTAWSGQQTGGPQAELWFGVHPGGPSPLVDTMGELTGEDLGDHFDIEAIPLLVKLLAAARPLSVQVHPPAAVAAAGWLEQQEPGAPRILSDPFEKTEMLVALGHFEAFAGWRPVSEAADLLARLEGTSEAVERLQAGRLDDAIRALLHSATPAAVGAMAAAAAAVGLPQAQVAAYRTVAEQFPDDPGALVTPLLAFWTLQAGQCLYVPAGVPHSYVSGTGLEVMTSSDNVIRLGLTSKPVFVDRALEALVPGLEPQFMDSGYGDLVWPVSAPFVVRMLESGTERIPSGAYRILLSIEGAARVVSQYSEVTLRPGTAAVLSPDDADSHVEVDGLVAIVQSTRR